MLGMVFSRDGRLVQRLRLEEGEKGGEGVRETKWKSGSSRKKKETSRVEVRVGKREGASQ